MKWSATICGFAVAAFSVAATAADPPNEQSDSSAVTIPLDEIWANFMPGTRDIHTLEPEVFSSEASRRPVEEQRRAARESMINKIAAKLQPAPVEKEGPAIRPTPRPAFAVLGTGRKALQAASAVFDEGQKPQPSFADGSEISVVFFSYQAGSRVQLVEVERGKEVIRIRYRFFADGLTMSTSHLALIPLGPFPAGKYRVELVQIPMAGQFKHDSTGQIMDEWGRKLLCQPFSFSVVEQNER